jgi:hypothetical protein
MLRKRERRERAETELRDTAQAQTDEINQQLAELSTR